jgi:hypothetical protein
MTPPVQIDWNLKGERNHGEGEAVGPCLIASTAKAARGQARPCNSR